MEKKARGSPGPVELLLKDCSHMGVRGVYGKGYSSPRNMVSENRNGRQKEFGSGEGGF